MPQALGWHGHPTHPPTAAEGCTAGHHKPRSASLEGRSLGTSSGATCILFLPAVSKRAHPGLRARGTWPGAPNPLLLVPAPPSLAGALAGHRSSRHGRGAAPGAHRASSTLSPQPPRCPSPPRPSRNGDARGSRQRCSRDQARQGPAARGRQQTPQPSLHPSCSSPSARPGGHRFTQTATCLQKDFIKLQKYTNHPHN